MGDGGYWFRPYGELLGKTERRPAPSNQALLPLSFGASLRSCSVGPPRSAIPGRARLTRHPCRVAHCTEPPLGLSRGDHRHSRRGGLVADLALGFTRCLISGFVHRFPIGAGLLAIAVGQSTHLMPDRTSSPASRLLHRDRVHTVKIVGASLLAMDVNDDAGCLNERGVWAFFASRLAPTGNSRKPGKCARPNKRSAPA